MKKIYSIILSFTMVIAFSNVGFANERAIGNRIRLNYSFNKINQPNVNILAAPEHNLRE